MQKKRWGSNIIWDGDDAAAATGGVGRADAAFALLGAGAVVEALASGGTFTVTATGGTFTAAFAGADLAGAEALALAGAFAFDGGGAKAFPAASLESFGAIDRSGHRANGSWGQLTSQLNWFTAG